jgi:predicted ferric reductase
MQQSVRSPRAQPSRPHVPPLPKVTSIGQPEVWFIVIANIVVITGMWVIHGGIRNIDTMGSLFTAIGQITALLGTFFALVGIVLMARSPWLDQIFGLGGLAKWHRWVGFATLWLLVAHGIFTTVGFAMQAGTGIVDEFVALMATYQWVLMATVALGLMIAVGVASFRAARNRLSYETWYGIHLYAYLAVALAFLHEIVVGSDFVSDIVATAYWIALYVAVIVLVVVFRLGQPIALNMRHHLRVAAVRRESKGVVSIYIAGRHLDELPARPGQYFVWRFLSGGGWWRAHPFSLSAAPNGEYLRITIKNSGDDTGWIQHVDEGTRVLAEGPYGAFTSLRRRHQRVLLIAGGIGITPLRALLEEFRGPHGSIVVIYRAGSWNDVVFRDELDELSSRYGAQIHYLIGHRDAGDRDGIELDAYTIARLVPDVRVRDIFVCGPDLMMDSVHRNLRALDVSNSQIHVERFAY